MSTALDEWRAMSSPPRWMVAGGIGLGVLGGIVGLIVGLFAYPPTAWAAIFELGMPAALAGLILGIFVDLVFFVSRRLRRWGKRRAPVR